MMKAMCQLIIVVFLFYFCKQIDSASSEMRRSIMDGQDVSLFKVRSFCDVFKDLTPTQRDICHGRMENMGSVANGARLAKAECAKQFRYERWNCPSISGPSTMLGRMTKAATKEAAFNYALVAAGIVHTMARDCMKGELKDCHCSREKRPQSLNKDYIWGGCGDNIQYAADFSKRFLDDPRVEKLNRNTDAKLAEKLLMDNHNSEVGRQAIFKHRKVICKCHGATNHCTKQTCWYQVRKFNVIGDYLKQKYRSAKRAKLVNKKGGRKVALKVKNNDKSDFLNELIYTEDAPSYCHKKLRAYSLGTFGRQCNTTTTGLGSCKHLCCGRGYKTERRIESKKCNCKFHWCCDVKCEQCKEEVEVHTCV